MYIYVLILLVGAIICAIAINFFIKYRLLKANVRMIRDLETSNIADLRAIQQSIAESIGRDGAWREQVELKGIVIAEHPLIAKLSNIPCVYYHTVVEQQYERTEYETDDDGNTDTKDVIETKIVDWQQNKINFYLEDKTDQIFVNLEGAEIDGMTVVNEFESCDREESPDYRILGYQRTEKIIELKSVVYILGEVNDFDGRLQISTPSDRQTPFIISYRSESELIKQRQRQGRGKLLWGIFILLHGCALIVFALVSLLIQIFDLAN